MDDTSKRDQAVELLRELGLKEYEARCFVALSRLPQATAKEISEVSDVPRTRVYDAVKVLEADGLVEVQHSNPQQFRAVGVDEAVETLRTEYEQRAESLRETLLAIDPPATTADSEGGHEVWSLSGRTAIANRVERLLADATEEVTLVVGHEAILDGSVREGLRAARDRGVAATVRVTDAALRDRAEALLPGTEVAVGTLDWLAAQASPEDRTCIGRVLLVDREALLLGTVHGIGGDGPPEERAVFGHGADNGLVAVARRLLATADPPEAGD